MGAVPTLAATTPVAAAEAAGGAPGGADRGVAGEAWRLRLTPAPALLRCVLGLFLCACLAPVWPPALAVAGVAAAVLALAAMTDWAREPGARLRVTVANATAAADGRGTCAVRLTAGCAGPVVLRLTPGAPARAPQRIRIAAMAATAEFERYVGLPAGAHALTLMPPGPWSWEFEVQPQRRGTVRGLRCGIERASQLGFWRVRQWETMTADFRVYPDLRAIRRALLRSPVYRAVTAAARAPTTGQGREFERLREYLPGDGYADVSWKATARRAFPVTRLFQWEQRQQIFFVLDHSRSARIEPREPAVRGGGDGREGAAPGPPPKRARSWLDCYVEAAIGGAIAARDLGDEFGLIAFNDRVTEWLPAGSGGAHFADFRERLLRLRTGDTTADFDRLFATLRARLRRRAYLLVLASLAEPGLSEPFTQAANLVSSHHVMLACAILPEGVRPMSDGPPAAGLDEVYERIAGDMEFRRLRALGDALAIRNVRFRAVPADMLVRTAVDGYLEGKRSQRL